MSLEKGKRAHFTKLFFEDPDLQLLDGVERSHQKLSFKRINFSRSLFSIYVYYNNVMKRFNLDPYFKDKLSGADLKASKPHPEIFIKLPKLQEFLIRNVLSLKILPMELLQQKKRYLLCCLQKCTF